MFFRITCRMTRRVGVITGSRADYGFLKWVMRSIEDQQGLSLHIIVTGMHLEDAQGKSVSEITNDDFDITAFVPIHSAKVADDASSDIFARCVASMGQTLQDCGIDVVVVLGDRLEALASSVAAYLANIPIAHIHGGESTDGSQDNGFRDAITQLATWHFPCMNEYRDKILRMVRTPSAVWNVGALAVESIKYTPIMSRRDVLESLDLQNAERLAVSTYHPVTLETEMGRRGLEAMLEALNREEDLVVLFTASNSDQGGAGLNRRMQEFVDNNVPRFSFIPFLGQKLYINLMRHADFMIGNSSSAFFEAAILGLPAINVGCRQQGRYRPEDISRAIKRASSRDGRLRAASSVPLYGDGTTARKIATILSGVQVPARNVADGCESSSERNGSWPTL